MRFTVLTIFPEMFDSFLAHGIVRRAIEQKQIVLDTIDIRAHAKGRHQVTDDRPYGGGCGMVMKPEPLAAAIRTAKTGLPDALTVHLTPQGRVFDQTAARQLADATGLILVCGRYEGIDERVCEQLIDLELSIGDFVLTGGELPAMVLIDAVTRLLPGVLGGKDSTAQDSFNDDLLAHAQYTRPREFEGRQVPPVLLSGDHGQIAQWRLESALIRTLLKRPDLLQQRDLASAERQWLQQWCDTLNRLLAPNGQ